MCPQTSGMKGPFGSFFLEKTILKTGFKIDLLPTGCMPSNKPINYDTPLR